MMKRRIRVFIPKENEYPYERMKLMDYSGYSILRSFLLAMTSFS